MRHSPAVYFASYGLSLLGKGIASVVMPLLVLDRTGDGLGCPECSRPWPRRPRPRPGSGPGCSSTGSTGARSRWPGNLLLQSRNLETLADALKPHLPPATAG